MSTSQTILIVGAGPTGLVLALSLLRNGISVRIIDKLPLHRIGFKGPGIQPRTLEVYEHLGVLPGLQEISVKLWPMKTHLANGDTKVFEFFERLEDTPDRPYNNGVMLSQARHEQYLRDVIFEAYGCTVELNTELAGLAQTADGVTAHLVKHHADGPDTTEEFSTPYLVGADGGHSVTRKLIGLSFLGEMESQGMALVGDIYIKSGMEPDYWHVWGDRVNQAFSFRAFENQDGRFNFLIAGKEVDIAAAASREGVIETFEKISGISNVEFGDLIWASQFNFRTGMLSAFTAGRVALAGDACHVHSPAGGQGMNTGIQDAFNLGWKLALVLKGASPPNLLETYDLERIPVVATMLKKTVATMAKIMTVSEAMSTNPDTDLRQLGINYRGSRIVVDDFAPPDERVDFYRSGNDGAVRAGDRAPDAPGLLAEDGKVTTLFKSGLLAPDIHTLLIFSEDVPGGIPLSKPELFKVAIVLPEGFTPAPFSNGRLVVDSEGWLYKNYKVVERGVRFVIVRPDGVIGAITKKAEGVTAYTQQVFV